MSEKIYQIFISSTYEDLKIEREKVMQAILNLNHMPAGMELFTAADDEQFNYIKKVIDNCDYYVVIIGGRYGSISPATGKSYTEMEYEYAQEKNIPVLAFLRSSLDNLPRNKHDEGNQIDAFREKVGKSRMCKMWETPDDLAQGVILSLVKVFSEIPQKGWSRNNTYNNSELLTQLNQLRIENERLREVNAKLKNASFEKHIPKDLASGSDQYTVTGLNFNSTRWVCNVSWDNIFALIGPKLISQIQPNSFKLELTTAIQEKYDRTLRNIDDICIQTIMIQLEALGLIKIAAPTGLIEVVSITPYGREYLTHLLAQKKPVDLITQISQLRSNLTP